MVNFAATVFDRSRCVPEGLWTVIVIIVFVIVYTLAKVFQYMRESEEQWRRVDKSKLRQWDDDDWPED